MRRKLPLAALAVAIVASTALLVPTANASFPGRNGRIAYVTPVGDHNAIYTVDATGGDPQPLIDLGSGRDAINPSWSWDGTKIAFAGQTSPGGQFAIYTANGDGSGTPRQETTPPVSDTDPTWDPEGGQIAFVRAGSDGSSRIHIVDLTTSQVRALGSSAGTDLEPAWSPEGSTIAFVSKKFPVVACPERGCRYGIFIAHADGSGPVAGDPSGLSTYQDWHHPDWSPDASKMIATFGDDTFPYGPFGVELMDASSGIAIDRIGPCGIMTEPVFSPDGTSVIVTSTTPVSPPEPNPGAMSTTTDDGWTEPALCVIETDGSAPPFWVGPTASDATWRAVPGSAPVPQRDTKAPTVTLSFTPDAGPDGSFSSPPEIVATATDNIGVQHIGCSFNGQSVFLSVDQIELIEHGLRATLGKLYRTGSDTLECWATDLLGNRGFLSQIIYVGVAPPSPSPSPSPPQDTTPPYVEPPSFGDNPIAVGRVTTVTTFAWDDESGIAEGSITIGNRPPEPMAWSDPIFTTEVGHDLASDLYPVSVRVRDAAGNEAASDAQTLAVYDPDASVSGTGWIIPNPSAGDDLPGIDGKTKGSFSVAARYKRGATTPTGSFAFTYGRFKLYSDPLDWVVVTSGDTAYLQGTGVIRNDGAYPFRVTIRDGRGDIPDHLVLAVCACTPFVETGPMIFRASGDVGGQIQIQR